ncbi:MAG: hypothetical protein KGR26_16275, partial [Cyanobacteria bacterium REEB65]|nr:hypothetical protein [Cyanobacteria bacterium REEB65]
MTCEKCAAHIEAVWKKREQVFRDRFALGTHPAWSKMLTAARGAGWPEQHQGDLAIDEALLSQLHPGEPFVWQLSERGTHLFNACMFDGTHRAPGELAWVCFKDQWREHREES